MVKPISILDKDYSQWLKDLSSRYRRSQIKAAVKVNQEMLQFYWELGRDIVERDAENKYGSAFYATLSRDLKNTLPEATSFSETTIRYSKRLYQLYNQILINIPQVGEKFEKTAEFTPQLGEQKEVSHIEHYKPQFFMIDKYSNNLFCVRPEGAKPHTASGNARCSLNNRTIALKGQKHTHSSFYNYFLNI